ncbi:MAG: phosphoserine phosphatase SerB [Rhodoluna sp.]
MTKDNSRARMLVVFDVDSTLIQDEVIELLADHAGKRAEVEAVTERAMTGELDFEGSLRARVITLKGLSKSVIDETLARIQLTDGALEVIEYIHSIGGKAGAVSGGFVELLEPLAKRLNLDFYRANQLEVVDGVLTGNVIGQIIDKPAKAQALSEWAKELGISEAQCVAVGDGANDLDMMNAAGLSVGFNAKPRVRAQADLLIGTKDLRDLIPLLGL